jgi:hypothetical protein
MALTIAAAGFVEPPRCKAEGDRMPIARVEIREESAIDHDGDECQEWTVAAVDEDGAEIGDIYHGGDAATRAIAKVLALRHGVDWGYA